MISFNILGFISIVLILITSLIALYFYLTRDFNFWKKRGIDGPKPILFLGTAYQLIFRPIQEVLIENTQKYGKIYGSFIGHRPALVISDPELIKDVCIKDFHLFVDHNDFQIGDPFTDNNLFNLMGDEWKRMRSIISPTFSSGKMRRMHPIIIDCVKRLQHILDKKAFNEKNNEFDLKDMMSDLTMDVMTICAFGTKVDVYNKEKRNPFIENAEKVFKPSVRTMLFVLISYTFPKLLRLLRLDFESTAGKFFNPTFKSIIKRRKSENRVFNDYLQLMLNAMNKTSDIEEPELESHKSEQIFGQTDENFKAYKTKGDVTEMDVLATSFIFFIAGYEATSSLLSFLFYSLAVNEKCQQKLYEELNKFEGNFDYESIAKMPYLEACVAETLRLYNINPQTMRMSSEEYTFRDSGITIPKGMIISLDVETIHHNPEYYPEPQKWDPERFMPENRNKLTPYTYMPFGIGPRNCVGMRFALMEAKTAIAYLVHKYNFIPTINTKPLMKPLKYTLVLNRGNINIGIKMRDV